MDLCYEAGAAAYHIKSGVDGDRRLLEGDVEDDIRGLAADPGKFLEQVAVRRHLAPVFGDQHPAQDARDEAAVSQTG